MVCAKSEKVGGSKTADKSLTTLCDAVLGRKYPIFTQLRLFWTASDRKGRIGEKLASVDTDDEADVMQFLSKLTLMMRLDAAQYLSR